MSTSRIYQVEGSGASFALMTGQIRDANSHSNCSDIVIRNLKAMGVALLFASPLFLISSALAIRCTYFNHHRKGECEFAIALSFAYSAIFWLGVYLVEISDCCSRGYNEGEVD